MAMTRPMDWAEDIGSVLQTIHDAMENETGLSASTDKFSVGLSSEFSIVTSRADAEIIHEFFPFMDTLKRTWIPFNRRPGALYFCEARPGSHPQDNPDNLTLDFNARSFFIQEISVKETKISRDDHKMRMESTFRFKAQVCFDNGQVGIFDLSFLNDQCKGFFKQMPREFQEGPSKKKSLSERYSDAGAWS